MGAFFACCRSFVPDDGPVYGVVMHPGEYFGNVTMRVTKLFKVRGKAETEKEESSCVPRTRQKSHLHQDSV